MIKKNIILVGFMGCGKSTIGRCISNACPCEFIDTDHKIQDDTGMSINNIFDKYGEKYFRKLERNLCKLVSLNNSMVVATGGGIIKDKSNVETLKINGVIVYLKSTPEKIYRNIKFDTTRPLLNVEDKEAKIRELLEERRPLYEGCADITVDVSELKIEESVAAVLKAVEEMES